MTQYVIKMSNGYIFPALKGGFPTWTRFVKSAQRFDSVTEAELFALAYGLGRYTVQPTPLQEEPMFERFTDRARKVCQFANQEAIKLHHEQIEPGHILIGLALESSGIAVNVLRHMGISLDQIRAEVEKLMPSTHLEIMALTGRLPSSPATQEVYRSATKDATLLGDNYVGTEHLLLGLLFDPEGIPARVLTALGVTMEAVKVERDRLLGLYLSSNCERCGTPLQQGLCGDETCPFSDHLQTCAVGWSGHPEKDGIGPDGVRPCISCTCDANKEPERDPANVHDALLQLDQILTKAKAEGDMQELRNLLVAALAVVNKLVSTRSQIAWQTIITWRSELHRGLLKVLPPDSDCSSILKASSETTGEQSG